MRLCVCAACLCSEEADSSAFGEEEGEADGAGEGVDGVDVAGFGVAAGEAPAVADGEAGGVGGVVVEERVVVVEDLAAFDEFGESHAGFDDGAALEGFVGGCAGSGVVEVDGAAVRAAEDGCGGGGWPGGVPSGGAGADAVEVFGELPPGGVEVGPGGDDFAAYVAVVRSRRDGKSRMSAIGGDVE